MGDVGILSSLALPCQPVPMLVRAPGGRQATCRRAAATAAATAPACPAQPRILGRIIGVSCRKSIVLSWFAHNAFVVKRHSGNICHMDSSSYGSSRQQGGIAMQVDARHPGSHGSERPAARPSRRRRATPKRRSRGEHRWRPGELQAWAGRTVFDSSVGAGPLSGAALVCWPLPPARSSLSLTALSGPLQTTTDG